MTWYDVIIVGAGPGGSTLATRLAKQGLKTLLLDKSPFPRYKVCGGGLTLRAAQLLDLDVNPVIRDRITSLELSHGGDHARTFSRNSPFIYMVMRDELDQLLVESAVNAGVHFRPSHSVRKVEFIEEGVIVSTGQINFRGSMIVGADGVNSTIAKQLGLMATREAALALEYELNVKDDLLQKYEGKMAMDYGLIPDGYAWIFPKGDHLSVGIGGSTKDGVFLQKKLDEYINREKLSGELTIQKGFFLSSGGQDQQLINRRGALIGDAAGLVDPFGGEGIYYAILSGKILAEVLLANCSLEHYQLRVQTEILPELRMLKRFSHVFYSVSKWAHHFFVAHPAIVEQAIHVIAGELSYMDFYDRELRENFILKAIATVSPYFSTIDVGWT